MEFNTAAYLQATKRGSTTVSDNPFVDAFPDPLCKLNLDETSEFVKDAFPMTTTNKFTSDHHNHNRRKDGGMMMGSSSLHKKLETPSTPGRLLFSFSPGHLSRKNIPSKWEDAEKWLNSSSSCHESPAHFVTKSTLPPRNSLQYSKNELFIERQLKVTDEKDSNAALNGDVLLKDKFTDNVEPVLPKFRYLEPLKEGFLFRTAYCEPVKDATTMVEAEVQRRDVGTEMTPLGSSTTTRCHTPIKVTSPARHNTPDNRSGPLVASNSTIDIAELKDCHFAKLELSAQYNTFVSNWSSREEEEKEVSKSLRHLEINGAGKRSIAESRVSIFEEEERTKSCIRYQREEAKIQAWVNLQKAKAEAQSKKLEVKIQNMRSSLEEKLMKRMAVVHRRAEELRAAAQLQHTQQIQRASDHAQKMKNQYNSRLPCHTVCGCFPCHNI